jgi:glyoxylase-like metal-dependent hydrolase (beta-lactamase superfamily II)
LITSGLKTESDIFYRSESFIHLPISATPYRYPEPETNMTSDTLIRESFPVGPLQCNCTIIGDPISKKALVIDPGGDHEYILQVLAKSALKVVAIIHTHAHLDHFLASAEIKKVTGAPLYLHEADKPLWDMADMQAQMFLGTSIPPMPDPDYYLKDDQALDVANGIAMHTPGHTPGSMSFWFEEHNLLVAGDTLFKQSIGRTDLPGGSYEEIEKSIRERLYTLNDEAIVITGHGEETTIGDEKQGNMFFRI